MWRAAAAVGLAALACRDARPAAPQPAQPDAAVAIDAPHELATVPPYCRLFPPSVIEPLQLPTPGLLATIVFRSVTDPALTRMLPPADPLFAARVLLMIVRTVLLAVMKIPPPLVWDVLLTNVELVIT